MGEQGCDYAWGRPDPKALYAAGYRFVCRYLSYDTTGKNLTMAEAEALHGAGLSIVLNWEGWAGGALGGFVAGQNDAREAIVQRGQLGAPAHTPIYFSVDINATPFQLGGPIANYFAGIRTVLPVEQIGVYGGYATVQAIMGSGLASYGWQTYAWSAGQWGNARLRQTANGVPFHGVYIDVDQSTVDNFGQWNPDGSVSTMSEWHDTTGIDPAARITQGSPTIAGQQRDTVLAITADHAITADEKLDRILAILEGQGSTVASGQSPTYSGQLSGSVTLSGTLSPALPQPSAGQ